MAGFSKKGNPNDGPLPPFTPTALNRWSIAGKDLPAVDTVKALHVYDFDNTLFNSPLPNPKLWNGPTIGLLQTQDTIMNGGWWHDSRILGATGEGREKEEARAWEGWWNESIVSLVELSMKQKDVLTVLLTGRSEKGFPELITKMVNSKGLEFDLIALKPAAGPSKQRFHSTMNFKQVFLESMVETYSKAEEIRIYEDRPKHTKAFRDFFQEYNRRQHGTGGSPTRGPIIAEVVQVADAATLLDPIREAAEVQRMINDHNLAISNGARGRPLEIKKTVFYTGYLINNTDTQKLLTLAQLPPNIPETTLMYLANNILITPRPCQQSILDKVGGMGSKTTWEVVGTGVFENNIWAAKVQPVPADKKYYTENPTPIVVLALKKGARPIDAGKINNWQPVPLEKQYIFESTVGEKVLLRIEEADPEEGSYESLFPSKSAKRKHAPDGDSARREGGPNPYSSPAGGRNGFQNNNSGNNNNRGGRGNFRGNNNARGGRGGNGRGGGGGGARGRGRGHNYRSLDDVGEKGNAPPPSYNNAIAYEDFPPLQKQYQTPQQLVQQQFQQYSQWSSQQGKAGNSSKQGGSTGELQYF